MKKTRTKINTSRKAIAFILAVLAFFSTATVAIASEDYNEVTPCYTDIKNHNEMINISGIKATCSADIRVNSSKYLKIVMELQKKKSNGYETVKTWTSSKTGTTLSMSESRNINALCTYRLKVTYTAGSEQVVAYKY